MNMDNRVSTVIEAYIDEMTFIDGEVWTHHDVEKLVRWMLHKGDEAIKDAKDNLRKKIADNIMRDVGR